MSDTAAKLDILIDIQAKLGELLKTQEGLRSAKQEATSFGALLKQGLGIGTGIEIARRGIELIKDVIVESTREAFRMAGQLKDTAENLQISTDALQVLSLSAESGGANMEKLVQSLVHLKQAVGEARTGIGATATAFNDLNLDAARLSQLPLERQLEAVARSVFTAKDQSKAFNEALQILGARTAPQLMNMLRDLAGDGFDKLAISARNSGRIMEQETIERLDRAQKQIERVKRSIVIFAGESIASLSKLLGMGGGASTQAALQPGGEDFWTVFNRQSLTAGQAQLNMLKEQFQLQQALSANSPYKDITNNVALILLDRMRDRLTQNIRLAAEDLPEAFRKLSTAEFGKFPRSLLDILPANVGKNDKTLNEMLRGLSDENLKKIEAVNKALAELWQLQIEMNNRSKGRTGYNDIQDQFQIGRASRLRPTLANPNALTPAQGFVGGVAQWATQLGSVGEQVAGTINSTIGESVRGVSQELANWAVTGKMSGDILAQVGMSVFTGWITQIVQMGVQWLVTELLIKTGLITTDALQSTLLAKKTVEVNAANAATLPANTANAAASSVSSFGLAAVLGLAAMLAVMAMFGGFRESGGEVTPGRAYVVGERRPEVFVPSGAGRIVPSAQTFTRTAPGLGSSSPVSASKPRMLLLKPSTQQEFDALRRLPEWDVHVVDSVMRNRGTILNA